MFLDRRMTRRSFVALAPAAVAAIALTPTAHAEGMSHFGPLGGHGPNALSEVYLSAYDYGANEYRVEMTVIPTQNNIDHLLAQGDTKNEGSHVDFLFTFHDLSFSGREEDYWVEWSDEVRSMRQPISPGFDGPTVTVEGMNIIPRWFAGVPFTIYINITGRPEQRISPRLSVSMRSSTWWTYDGSCTIDYERGTGQNKESFCSKQEDEYATLYGPNGRSKFQFWR